jgi:hypothetical protein
MFKSIELRALEIVKIVSIKNLKFLVLKTIDKSIRYFFIPDKIDICIKNKMLKISCVSFNTSRQFIDVLSNYLSKKKFKIRLFLKGLGYKMSDDKENRLLIFKLGFSHIKRIKIPSDLSAHILKNCLNLESDNKSLVGNFAAKIIQLKSRDAYKGKGFWSKYKKENLKIIKKK